MMRILNIFLLSTCLAGCSTTPSEIKLYSLSLAASVAYESSNDGSVKSDRPILQISPVKLAGYLSSRNLVIQTNHYQINNAAYHLWAEDLDKAIAEALLNKLQPLDKRFLLVNNSAFQKETARYQLHLEFDAFHATDQSQVISKGKYWIVDDTDNLILLENFSYALTLKQDGYLHSVEKLNQTLDLLATDIIQSSDLIFVHKNTGQDNNICSQPLVTGNIVTPLKQLVNHHSKVTHQLYSPL